MTPRSSADIQIDLTAATAKLSSLQTLLANSQARFNDWNHLCQTQKCDQNALNIVNSEATNITNYTNQINAQQQIVNDLNIELKQALEYEGKIVPPTVTDNIAAAAAIAKEKNYRTALWVGIVLVVIVIGSWVWYKFYKKS